MKTTLAVLSIALMTTAAHAQSTETGAYVGLGYSFLTSDIASGFESFDNHMLNGRIGYDFSKYFGAEGEVLVGLADDDFTIPGVGAASAKIDYGLGAFAKAQYPLTDKVRLFARIGYIYQEATIEAAGVSASDGDSGFAYGGGAEFNVVGPHGVRFDYTRYDYGQTAEADGFGASYIFRF